MEYTSKLKGLLPNVIKSVNIPFTEQKASYQVSIYVAKSGSTDFKRYAEYQVDGTKGKAQQSYLNPNVFPASSDSSTSSKPTDSSTPNSKPDKKPD